MRLDLLAKLLEDASLGVCGTSIFLHRLDADTAQGIMLRLPLDGAPIDTNLPGYYKHSIQVVVRARDQATGDTLSRNVQAALTIYKRSFFDVGGGLLMKINHLIPKTLPRVYPQLASQSIEWSMDFNANYVMP